MLPTNLADGTQGTEYQYSFYRNGESITGLGFRGPDRVVERDGRREHVFVFDLGHDWLIKHLLRLKAIIEASGDDFLFLQHIAQGLVLAYGGQTDNKDNLRYVAVTTPDALASCGVLFSEDIPASTDGTIVLAEVSIAAHLT